MKKLKKITRLYKKACLEHRKAKKAFLKAKAKEGKKDKLMKFWKQWQKAKYYKKALGILLQWEETVEKKQAKKKKAKKDKARAKSDQDKKSKNKKGKNSSPSLSTKLSPDIGPAPVEKKLIAKAKKQAVSRRPASQNTPSVARNSMVKPKASIQLEDLKKVEGIGPKIEQILYTAGIKTYKVLAGTSVEKLRIILVEAGPRFRMHSPVSWPSQAKLAARGRWAELKKLQEQLKKNK